jgi:hypothetical protein
VLLLRLLQLQLRQLLPPLALHPHPPHRHPPPLPLQPPVRHLLLQQVEPQQPQGLGRWLLLVLLLLLVVPRWVLQGLRGPEGRGSCVAPLPQHLLLLLARLGRAQGLILLPAAPQLRGLWWAAQAQGAGVPQPVPRRQQLVLL